MTENYNGTSPADSLVTDTDVCQMQTSPHVSLLVSPWGLISYWRGREGGQGDCRGEILMPQGQGSRSSAHEPVIHCSEKDRMPLLRYSCSKSKCQTNRDWQTSHKRMDQRCTKVAKSWKIWEDRKTPLAWRTLSWREDYAPRGIQPGKGTRGELVRCSLCLAFILQCWECLF